MTKLLLVAQYVSGGEIWWRHLKPWLSCYNWKMFSTAVLTLNFDPDLSKLSSDMWHISGTLVSNFMKIQIVVFDKSQRAYQSKQQMKQPTNKPAWSQYLTVWVKRIPRGFLAFFPKRLGILNQFIHTYYTFLSTLDYKFLFSYLRLWRNCHIKCDQLACVLADGGHFEHMMWTGWSRLICHNFVKVAGNWIKNV